MPVSKKSLTETCSHIFQLEKYIGETIVFVIYYNWRKCLKLNILQNYDMSMNFSQEYFTSYRPWYPVNCIYKGEGKGHPKTGYAGPKWE